MAAQTDRAQAGGALASSATPVDPKAPLIHAATLSRVDEPLAITSGQHLTKALLLPAELYPRLCAVAIDFGLWLHPAPVVQSADAHHHNARQHPPHL